jgi:hypothetical protein
MAMNRSLAAARVAALLVTCLAACGGDDAAKGTTTFDSGSDATAPSDDADTADGTVAESGTDDTGADANAADTGTDGSIADTGADANAADTGTDGNIADTGADGSLTEAGLDGGLADAHADGAATDAAVEAGPSCSVNNTALAITETVSDAAAVPVQTGGSLISGTYFLTSYTYFGGNQGCGGSTIKWTLVVSATNATTGNLAEVIASPASSTPSCANQVPYATSGAHLLADDGGASATTFTVNGSTLTLATVDSGACGSAVTVFTKQP